MSPKKSDNPGKAYISVYIARDTLERLDEKRGLIPRNAYINDLIRKDLES